MSLIDNNYYNSLEGCIEILLKQKVNNPAPAVLWKSKLAFFSTITLKNDLLIIPKHNFILLN